MLTGKGFNIRHIVEDDLDALIPLLNNLEIRGDYLSSGMTSPREIRQKFKENGLTGEAYERLLIVDKKDNILGTIWHFTSVPYFNAREIGYTLFEIEQRNKGIVTQAVALLSKYLFDITHVNRLEIRMDIGNKASEKVAIKCGFKAEGIARGANFVYGKHVDMCVYALLRDEHDISPEQ